MTVEGTIDRGVSEFGGLFADYIAEHPGCRGVVLTDDDGNPIDHARRPGLSALDLQIAGAQVERALAALRARGGPLSASPLGVAALAERGYLLARELGDGYTLVALHRRMDGLHSPTAGFDALAAAIEALLDG